MSAPPTKVDAPSRTDRFARALSEGIGGPIGRYVQPGTSWFSPVRVALLVATLTYVIGVIWRLPCRITAPGQSPDHFKYLCYSDISLLYSGRGLLEGNTPYLDTGDYPVLEYPVLTGWFLELERRITVLLGGPTGPGLSDAQRIDATALFLNVNVALLGALFLLSVWAHVRTTPNRPWDVIMVAGAPVVAAAALINWDMLPIALTALGLMFWSQRRPGLAGLLLGLGMAAKLYPAFLLGPLLLLCLRSRKMREFGIVLVGFAVGWLGPNLPVMLLAPAEWLSFWTFNSDRGGDFGSIWYVFTLAGHPAPHLNTISAGLFVLSCLAIGWLIMVAPRRPRLVAMAFLVVAAFLMINKVYSPQYVLWLLPFVVLARPNWRDWLIFTAGELFYFVAIWWHLGGFLAPGDGAPDRVYWASVIVRLCTQGYLVIMVVLDALQPERDVVRADGSDDSSGGVFDGAADAPWVASLRFWDRPLGRPRDRQLIAAEVGEAPMINFGHPVDQPEDAPPGRAEGVGTSS